ncbi:hypothetical protein EV360DRAFT_78509 [Lentinula raphanica]|nr:hypothetical protein EV360DRAFT_78509 [Lentinula raphanica]
MFSAHYQVLLQQLPFFPPDRTFKQLTGFVSPINESDLRRTTGSQTPMLKDSPSSRPKINYCPVDNVAQNMRSGLGKPTKRSTMTSPAPTRSSMSTNNGRETGSSSMPKTTSNPASPTAPDTEDQFVVVPVIVVGLQCVNLFWFTEPLGIPRILNGNTTPNPAEKTLRSSPTPSILLPLPVQLCKILIPRLLLHPPLQHPHPNKGHEYISIARFPFPLPNLRPLKITTPNHDFVTGAGRCIDFTMFFNSLRQRLPFLKNR